MKIVVSNKKSKLITDNPEILKVLGNLYSFKVPGAEYTPSYRRRQWDGKKRFFSNTGSFGTGMLESVLADLKKIECTPDIEYKYESSDVLSRLQLVLVRLLLWRG